LARLKNFLSVEVLPLELADSQSIATCAIRALELTRGKLDALFNNAAFGQPGAVEDLMPSLLREQFEVNVIGTHDLTRRLIPAMRKNGSGRIVNCSSVLGMVVAPYRGAYCASKFALEALTASLRLELEGSGISVSLIEPGPIRSRFVEHAVARLLATVDIENSPHRDIYRARIEAMKGGGQAAFKLEPEAVTRRLIHAVESSRPRRHYYVTTPTYLAAAMRRLLPQFAIDYFARNS
jgi:short-subunit dehydrogenase